MKRIFAFALIMSIIISFTACGKTQSSNIDEKLTGKLMSQYKDLKDLPEKYDPETAAKYGDVVNVHIKNNNIEKLDAFMEKYKSQEPAVVRVTQYTDEGDAVISDVIYDGKTILLRIDNTRDRFSTQENRKVINYKATDIILTESNGGTVYNARLANGDMIPVIWINGK